MNASLAVVLFAGLAALLTFWARLIVGIRKDRTAVPAAVRVREGGRR